MMEESPEEAAKRENMLKMYHCCKESLRIIGKLMFWIVERSFYLNAFAFGIE